LLRSPTPISPEPPGLYPGSSPSTPLLPTLEALQRGLFRSNSAGGNAGRLMALHKLTGGTEMYDPSSPTPSSLPGKLSRNNTVSGGERDAARQFMLTRLGGRFAKENDGDQASGEEISAPSPTPKRRRRRSRRGSTTANMSIPDAEFPTTPSTPVPPPTPLPAPSEDLTDLRAESATPYAAPNLPTPDVEQITESPHVEQVMQGDLEPEKPGAQRRRSLVVEDDDSSDEERHLPARTHSGLPSQRNATHVAASRAVHASDAPSTSPVDSVSQPAATAPYADLRTPPVHFPSSPFTPPLKEPLGRDEDEDRVVYHADSYRARTPYGEIFDREISWVASPGTLYNQF
jgi:hypothetical protein